MHQDLGFPGRINRDKETMSWAFRKCVPASHVSHTNHGVNQYFSVCRVLGLGLGLQFDFVHIHVQYMTVSRTGSCW